MIDFEMDEGIYWWLWKLLQFFDLCLDGGLNLQFWAPHLVLVNSILMQLNLHGSPSSGDFKVQYPISEKYIDLTKGS